MNNLIQSPLATDPNKQQPIIQGTMQFIQNATKEALLNMAVSLIGSTYDATKVYILFGCVKTTGGGNDIFSAGAVFYAGEVYTVPSAIFTTGTDYAYITVTNPSPDPILLKDGTSTNVHNVRQVVIASNSTPGAGQTAMPNYTAWVALQQWTEVLGGVGFQNSWVNNGGGARTAKFKIGTLGTIELDGVISGGASSTVAFTLPVGYRPSSTVVIGAGCDTTSITGVRLTISTNGNVLVVYAGSGGFVTLAGIRFAV